MDDDDDDDDGDGDGDADADGDGDGDGDDEEEEDDDDDDDDMDELGNALQRSIKHHKALRAVTGHRGEPQRTVACEVKSGRGFSWRSFF